MKKFILLGSMERDCWCIGSHSITVGKKSMHIPDQENNAYTSINRIILCSVFLSCLSRPFSSSYNRCLWTFQWLCTSSSHTLHTQTHTVDQVVLSKNTTFTHSVAYADSRDAVSGNAPSGERLQGKDRHWSMPERLECEVLQVLYINTLNSTFYLCPSVCCVFMWKMVHFAGFWHSDLLVYTYRQYYNFLLWKFTHATSISATLLEIE